MSKKKKYNASFDRDFNWYLKMRHVLNFDGCNNYHDKKGFDIVIPNRNGVSGKEAFYEWDSNGRQVPTKHPNLLYTLLKVKGSVNLHIKMFAEDRAKCNMNKIECRALCINFKAPNWFREAIEKQKIKFWSSNN